MTRCGSKNLYAADNLGNHLAFPSIMGVDHDSTYAVPSLKEIDIEKSSILDDKVYSKSNP